MVTIETLTNANFAPNNEEKIEKKNEIHSQDKPIEIVHAIVYHRTIVNAFVKDNLQLFTGFWCFAKSERRRMVSDDVGFCCWLLFSLPSNG